MNRTTFLKQNNIYNPHNDWLVFLDDLRESNEITEEVLNEYKRITDLIIDSTNIYPSATFSQDNVLITHFSLSNFEYIDLELDQNKNLYWYIHDSKNQISDGDDILSKDFPTRDFLVAFKEVLNKNIKQKNK